MEQQTKAYLGQHTQPIQHSIACSRVQSTGLLQYSYSLQLLSLQHPTFSYTIYNTVTVYSLQLLSLLSLQHQSTVTVQFQYSTVTVQ